MKTSYYAISGRERHAVSIAAKAPVWFKGREYKKLAPKYTFFKKYKLDGDEKYYTEQYYKEVLDKLDSQQVFDELGENAVLLCWEKKGEFCHRLLVAEWLEKTLGITIEEI
jgi:uncharacterized protein (DUF488 family)